MARQQINAYTQAIVEPPLWQGKRLQEKEGGLERDLQKRTNGKKMGTARTGEGVLRKKQVRRWTPEDQGVTITQYWKRGLQIGRQRLLPQKEMTQRHRVMAANRGDKKSKSAGVVKKTTNWRRGQKPHRGKKNSLNPRSNRREGRG